MYFVIFHTNAFDLVTNIRDPVLVPLRAVHLLSTDSRKEHFETETTFARVSWSAWSSQRPPTYTAHSDPKWHTHHQWLSRYTKWSIGRTSRSNWSNSYSNPEWNYDSKWCESSCHPDADPSAEFAESSAHAHPRSSTRTPRIRAPILHPVASDSETQVQVKHFELARATARRCARGLC